MEYFISQQKLNRFLLRPQLNIALSKSKYINQVHTENVKSIMQNILNKSLPTGYFNTTVMKKRQFKFSRS